MPRKSERHYPDDRTSITRFEELPNVGAAAAGDFRKLGFETPAALIGQDPYALYDRLSVLTQTRQDPCVADVFLATIRFMEGAPPLPWWHYTAERKRVFGAR
jgi:Pathogenicity locus